MKPPSSAAGVSDPPVKKRWWLALFGGGTFWISVLLHVFFGAVATYVVVEHFTKKHIDFHATEPPAPHTEVEHKVEMAKRNNVDSAPPDLKRITTTDLSPISLPDVPDTPKVSDATPSPMAGEGDLGEGMGGGNGTGGNGGGSPEFGLPDGTGLKGYLFDFKQTSDRKPTGMTEDQYIAFLSKYVAQGWDDSMMQPYYRTKAPLYADGLAISTRASEEAPKAFGVENEVQPGLWAVHYHVRVQAPQAGEYRLAGFADNVMVVKVRGETVLDAGWDSLTDKTILRRLLPYALPSYVAAQFSGHDPHIKIGPPFRVDVADTVDMDLLIGDCGGVCSFFLMIQAVGGNYEAAPDGTPKLPFFQLDSKPAPVFSDNEEHPPYSKTPEPWQAVGN
jgi:hypothetical protein